MGKLLVYNSVSSTGNIISPEVTAPADATCALVILSAPKSPINVFDITVYLDVFEDGKWQTRDVNSFPRDMLNGPLEAINVATRAWLPGISNKKVRARLSCGQCVLAISITLE